MTDVIDPNLPQPRDRTTVREHIIQNQPGRYGLAISDGWRPLCVWSTEECIYLAVLEDLTRPVEPEIVHVVHPGVDLGQLSEWQGKALEFLGHAGGKYLFLEVPQPEPFPYGDTMPQPERRIGRLDLEHGSAPTPHRRIGRLDIEQAQTQPGSPQDPG